MKEQKSTHVPLQMKEDDYRAEFVGLAIRKPLVTFQRACSIEWWGETPDLGD